MNSKVLSSRIIVSLTLQGHPMSHVYSSKGFLYGRIQQMSSHLKGLYWAVECDLGRDQWHSLRGERRPDTVFTTTITRMKEKA